MARAWIGTSGWQYDHWKDRFYPDDIPKKDWLKHYCKHFETVEVNNTFYSLPKVETVQDWKNEAPGDFIFSFKASRYLTHFKRLKDPEEPVSNLRPIANAFQPKLGVMLVQLPGRWNVNVERFENFLPTLAPKRRHAHEFRDDSWFCDEIYDLLRDKNDALCITDISGEPSPEVITADYTYIRLHGSEGAYKGSYSDKELDKWAKKIEGWLDDDIDVYLYFDNDEKAYATKDAKRLKERLE